MEETVPPAVRRILKEQPYLTWSTSDKDSINLDTAVSAILNYADFKEFKTLIKTVGIKKVKKIFERQNKGRSNYRPSTKNFFTLYFQKHAR